MFRYRVVFLDDTHIERHLEKNAVGKVLFDQVCEHLNLLERDYFGLAAWDSSSSKVWLDYSKEVHKQIIGHDPTFTFNVRFYPPDPSVLAEDNSRYLLCQQLRMDIMTKRLPCPPDMLAVLGSYTVQSDFGDYDPSLHQEGYLSNIPLAPSQTQDLEEKVTELHRAHKSMSPAQADKLFLQNAKLLPMYGVDRHAAQDASGKDVMLGVCADGIMIYDGEVKTQSFPWPRVLKIFYKRSKFYLRICDSQNAAESSVTFSLPNYRACKRLWKTSVEHHAFFRNHRQGKFTEGLQQLWSRFQFHGNTHSESVEASTNIKRPAPRFSRCAVKRKAKESMLQTLRCQNRAVLDDWVQVLDFDQSQPSYHPETLVAVQQTLAYPQAAKKYRYTQGDAVKSEEKEEPKESEEDKEWFELLAGRSFLTLIPQSLDADILESAVPEVWRQYAGDWFVLLDPHTSQLSLLLQKTKSFDEQTFEKIQWEKRTSGESISIVNIKKEVQFAREGPKSLEAEARQEKQQVKKDIDEMIEEGPNSLEAEARQEKQQVKKDVDEMIEEEGDEKNIQKVVISEQRIQEVEMYKGQPQEGFVKQRTMVVIKEETQEVVLEESQTVSTAQIEEVKKQLLEVESIEQSLLDVEGLKIRLQEVDFLEQKLQEEERGRQHGEQDDWYILLDRQLVLTAALASPTMETAKRRAEMRQWEDEVRQRAETLAAVQIKDDWYILLDSLSAQAKQLETSSDEEEEYRKWEEEKKMREEKRRTSQVKEMQKPLLVKREAESQDWFFMFDVSPQEAVQGKVSLVTTIKPEEEVKEITIEIQEIPVVLEEAESWFVLLEPLPFKQRSALLVTADSAENRREKEEKIQRLQEEQRKRQRALEVKPPPTMQQETVAQPVIEVKDDWSVLLEESGIRDTQVLEDRRLKEAQERQIQVKERSREMEDGRLLPHVLKLRAEEAQAGDQWFNLMEAHKVSARPPGGAVDRRAEEEQRRKEEQRKKLIMVEEKRKSTIIQEEREMQPQRGMTDDWLMFMETSAKEREHRPSPVHVISPVAVNKARLPPPSDQPLTSTPTTQPAPITRRTYQEESLERLDITQESEVETESVLIRKRREKRSEGESIYIRHSLLMLEDFDVTQEMVLRHHESISKLKRHFMEDVPMSVPTEWDKRLSTHTPVQIPQLTNGELLIQKRMMGEDEISAM